MFFHKSTPCRRSVHTQKCGRFFFTLGNKSTGEVTSRSTSKFTIFTICNYEKYQGWANERANKGQTEGKQGANRGQTKGKPRANKGQTEGKQRANRGQQYNKNNKNNKNNSFLYN